jgi:hypothetical protein
MTKSYEVKRALNEPVLDADWNGDEWEKANIVDIAVFRDRSSEHHPKTEAKLLYNENGIYGKFKVEDQYVRAVASGYQESVCCDSCVEFFVKPKTDKGYLNFEFSCGGAILCTYITDHTRTSKGFKEMVHLTDEDLDQVEIYHSLPSRIDPEITEPTEWFLGFFIPFSLFEKYVDSLGEMCGSKWRANFYKCADQTSHPHWASWNPITATNFHLPECFGDIEFE